MKKILAVILAAALCLTFCACGSLVRGLKESAENAVETANSASPKETGAGAKAGAAAKTGTPAKAKTVSADPEKTAAAEAVPLVQAKETSPKKTTETITPVISTARYAYAPVRVTKSPTGETVYEGGSASFIAYAENSTGISWLIVNPNGKDFVEASALAKAMPGLSISGTASTTLTIGCIPLSFDGWYIQAKFYGEGGPVHSSMARLSVWPYPAKTAPFDPWNGGCYAPPVSGGCCDLCAPGAICDPWSSGGTFDPWTTSGSFNNPWSGSCGRGACGGCCDPWTYEKSCDPWTYEKSYDPWDCGFERWY